MTYVVEAPCVLARDQRGNCHHKYEGDTIPWLSDEQAAQFIAAGLIEKATDTDPGDGGPPAGATKNELIAWLVDNAVRGDGSDYTAGSLQPQNKDELWKLVEAVQ